MTREQSAIVKGIGILLMLIYHVGAIVGLNDVFSLTLARASHPVCYFMIVSGYGLYMVYRQNRLTWSYLLKHAVRLYLAYWIVLLIFVFGLGSIFYPGKFSHAWDDVLLNLIGWKWDYCEFTWFLLPYILMSFSTKFIFPLIDRIGNVLSLVCTFVIYLGTSFTISRYFDTYLNSHYAVYHVILWLQTLFIMSFGTVAARIKLSGKSLTWEKLQGKNLLIILLIVTTFAIRGQIHTSAVNPFQAAWIVWLVLHVDFNRLVQRVFMELGNKSMMMWFVQGFVGVEMFREYYQPLQWPALVWVAWLIVCYLAACLLLPVANGAARMLRLTR